MMACRWNDENPKSTLAETQNLPIDRPGNYRTTQLDITSPERHDAYVTLLDTLDLWIY